jgi:hypothetical protein
MSPGPVEPKYRIEPNNPYDVLAGQLLTAEEFFFNCFTHNWDTRDIGVCGSCLIDTNTGEVIGMPEHRTTS